MATEPQINAEQRKQVLFLYLEAMGTLHDQIDELRHFPRGSTGAMMACAGVADKDDHKSVFDYNIEQAQRSMEISIMRAQQAISEVDESYCAIPPCSNERGPCERHA